MLVFSIRTTHRVLLTPQHAASDEHDPCGRMPLSRRAAVRLGCNLELLINLATVTDGRATTFSDPVVVMDDQAMLVTYR